MAKRAENHAPVSPSPGRGDVAGGVPAIGEAPRKAIPIAVIVLAAVAGLAGVAERAWLTSLAPRWAYPVDHPDNIQMGRTASQYGLLKVYGVPVPQIPSVPYLVYSDANGGFVSQTRAAVRPVNYPPLGETLFWLQSSLLEAVAPLQPANTFTSRAIMALASVLAEIIGVVGAFLLARRFVSPAASLLAAAACWLLPPMAMDSCFWGQTDAWFVAPALFTIYLMIRGRWVGAGILAAIAMLLKPQGLFLGPIVLFGAAVLPEETAGQGPLSSGEAGAGVRHRRSPFLTLAVGIQRLVRSVGAGAATALIIVLPWTIAGGWDWLSRAYVDNFTTQAYQETTLKAFNVWYLDALLTGSSPARDPLSCAAKLAGITKGGWGMALVMLSLAAVAVVSWKHLRRNPQLALLWFSALWLWSTFMWPTKVHERYIMYAIPLLVLCAFPLRRLWPAAIALTVVGAAELCHNVWLTVPPGFQAKIAYQIEYYEALPLSRLSPRDAEMVQKQRQELKALVASSDTELAAQRPWEYLVLAASLLGYAWAFACPLIGSGGGAESGAPPAAKRSTTTKRK